MSNGFSTARTFESGSRQLKQAMANAGWLLAQQACAIVIGLFITVWVARHLGTVRLGRLMFAFSLVSLFAPLLVLGLETIAIREIVKRPADARTILGSAFTLQLASGTLIVLGAVLWALRSSILDPEARMLVAIVALSLLPQTVNTIGFWFASRVQSRHTVLAQTSGLLLGGLLRVGLILMEAPLVAFAWAYVVEAIVAAVLLVCTYGYKVEPITRWRPSWAECRRLLWNSWPLILTDAGILIYTRIDQVMLRALRDDAAVGTYQAALFFVNGLTYLSMAIAASIYPHIVALHQSSSPLYLVRLRQLYDLLTWLALVLCLLLFAAPQLLIGALFGAEFEGAAPALAILVWSTLFMYQAVARSLRDAAENLQFYMQFVTIGACVVNIVLNFILIPKYSVVGAAIGTVVSLAVAALIGPMVFRQTRPSSLQLLRAFDAPYRYGAILVNRWRGK